MFHRRRLPLILAGACLLLASGAAAADPNEFSATSTPAHVKPSTSASYEVKLLNSAAISGRSRNIRSPLATAPATAELARARNR